MKHPRGFFADDLEMQLVCDPQRPEEERLLQPWRLNVTKEKLFEAIDEVERFCDWLQEQYNSWPKCSTVASPSGELR